MPLTIELRSSENQTDFNLQRWRELFTDPGLARLPYRIETDRHGHILMSPPPAPAHGDQQSEIVYLLKTLLPQGRAVTECPLSTSDGVKAVDVAWLAPDRRQEVRSLICLLKAPEICVEVLSPSNTTDEIAEKIALYFEAGAQEVWICDHGTLRFHFPTIPKIRPLSGMCPTFPPQIDI
jgi:Uma2 family endonuclease